MMKTRFAIAALILLIGTWVAAQDKPTFTTSQLTDNITMITSDEGAYTTNVLLFEGKDGLLLVDSNTEDKAAALKKLVDAYGRGVPKYIINTHRHVEHVGGNAIFGSEPVKIAHDLVRERLTSGSYLFDEFPEETLPDITLVDSLFLNFNGERIRVIAMPGSHDDNEIIVHFTKSKIVHLSSIINGLNFPSIDSRGNVLRFKELVARAIELLPHDVMIVSGHNKTCHWSDLQGYLDMLNETEAIVRKGLEAGKDVEALQKEHVLADYEKYDSSYVSQNAWISYLANGFNPEPRKKDVFGPIYYALKENGVEAAKELYLNFKNDSTELYEINDAQLVVIGDKLMEKGKVEKAIAMLELSLSEYPQGRYAYYVNYDLAMAHKARHEIDLAKKYCRESITLKPDFQRANKLLEELEKM